MTSPAFTRHVCPTSKEPIGLVVDHAKGCTLTTTDGREYLDLTAGIGVANIGHGRSEVRDAVHEQLARHAHVMVYGEYEQEVQTAFASRLAQLLPDPIDQVFLTSTGTEAIEGALKTARKHTGRSGLVAFEGGYHGDTMGALSLMSSPRYRAPFEPLVGPVTFLPFDDVAALDRIDRHVAAVVIEPVQGEGGIRVPARGTLAALRARTREVGALLVFDEVLTGFGRTGATFAMVREGVTPDLVCLAKAMGGGLPLGGFAGSRDILRCLSEDPPLCHVTTFGGHPISCAAGLAALDVLEREQLAVRAREMGARFVAGLEPLVGRGGLEEVRGVGLMLGLRFVDAEATRRFVERSLARGLLLGWTLHCDDIVRVTPPLVITPEEIDDAIARIGEAAGGRGA